MDATSFRNGAERVDLTLALGCLLQDAAASGPYLLSRGRGCHMGKAMGMAAVSQDGSGLDLGSQVVVGEVDLPCAGL